ncbi:hypothetical protein PAXRUDRAFT_19003 [Paxillus rubicundulus Ve08.2h10]|uniref:Uncharacterized protein n=1 Tax=Paxillus rubicundulus Ve08.2h10 TaxID=930991 RepID=A0A0D0CJW1_9AGAM|nr:hypothetical protein PAXRUDRAFT_19003 [Paxillus rubicundulus Ve08.2h10]
MTDEAVNTDGHSLSISAILAKMMASQPVAYRLECMRAIAAEKIADGSIIYSSQSLLP